MFCGNCGNKISHDGAFCDFCGHKLKKESVETVVSPTEKKDEAAPTPKPSGADVLWKKFLEIIRAEGNEAKKYQDLSSDAAWEIVSRLSTNALNNLTEEFKTDLDKQPYKAIESIKSYLQNFTLHAYQVFIAKQLLNKGSIRKVDIKDAEELAEEWKRLYLNMNNKIIVIPDDASTALSAIDNQIGEGLFNDNPTLKDVPKATADGIKGKLIQQLINGYLLGMAENNIRERMTDK